MPSRNNDVQSSLNKHAYTCIGQQQDCFESCTNYALSVSVCAMPETLPDCPGPVAMQGSFQSSTALCTDAELVQGIKSTVTSSKRSHISDERSHKNCWNPSVLFWFSDGSSHSPAAFLLTQL